MLKYHSPTTAQPPLPSNTLRTGSGFSLYSSLYYLFFPFLTSNLPHLQFHKRNMLFNANVCLEYSSFLLYPRNSTDVLRPIYQPPPPSDNSSYISR